MTLSASLEKYEVKEIILNDLFCNNNPRLFYIGINIEDDFPLCYVLVYLVSIKIKISSFKTGPSLRHTFGVGEKVDGEIEALKI